jgi:predicted CXXCH cytochrome family protein
VECLHCHTEIQHGSFTGHVETAGAACSTCHSDGHSPQRDLYVGIGGKGVLPRPSVMYLAGIHCEGCHFLPEEKGTGYVQSASAVSCMACHGPRYSKMLGRWQEMLSGKLDQARDELSRARRLLPPEAGPQLADAEANLRLVEKGSGVHNVDYALDILAANHAMLNAALAEAGRDSLPARWEAIPYQSPCLRCHQGVESQAGTFRGGPFAHQPHVLDQGLDCLTCHRPHEARTPEEMVSLPPDGCVSCHHAPEQRAECAECHRTITEEVVDFQGDEFEHEIHVLDEALTCTECHTPGPDPGLDTDFCTDCHD